MFFQMRLTLLIGKYIFELRDFSITLHYLVRGEQKNLSITTINSVNIYLVIVFYTILSLRVHMYNYFS